MVSSAGSLGSSCFLFFGPNNQEVYPLHPFATQRRLSDRAWEKILFEDIFVYRTGGMLQSESLLLFSTS